MCGRIKQQRLPLVFVLALLIGASWKRLALQFRLDDFSEREPTVPESGAQVTVRCQKLSLAIDQPECRDAVQSEFADRRVTPASEHGHLSNSPVGLEKFLDRFGFRINREAEQFDWWIGR